jgi:CIC family chloride channel protein
LSAIIILVELTGHYGMILPLMFTVVMATVVSRKINPESIYTERLARRGINAHGTEDLNILRAIDVKDILRHDEAVIEYSEPFESLVSLALNTRKNAIFVVDEAWRFKGRVLMQDLKYALNDMRTLAPLHTISDFVQEIPAVRTTQSLDTVIDLFAATDLDQLPVIDNEDRLVGSVVMNDVIRAYNEEVANRNIALELGARISARDESRSFRIGGETVVAEIDVPQWFVGCKLRELTLRSRFRVSVFIVKEKQNGKEPHIITPDAEYLFRQGDTLLVGGRQKDIADMVNGL